MLFFFNLVLETGLIPSDWSIGMIKPLYKGRGSPESPDNYRGITLLSCVGKLFTAVLNERIVNFIEANKLLGEEQAGFRSSYSTQDHIFTLHCILQWYLRVKKKRLYCAFVDYKKAFDLVDRSSLWSKLLNNNISGKILSVIVNLYNSAKSCVFHNGQKSSFFRSNVGVRQGENLSPILFALYLNDFNDFLQKNYKGLDSLCSDIRNSLGQNGMDDYIALFSLLYADDTIVLGESPHELQLALNSLFDYCRMWHLTVNTSKTKILIFSRGKIKNVPKFMFGGEELSICFDYTYLGIIFNYNNVFKKAIDKQVCQASRASYAMKMKLESLCLPLDLQLQLFDQLVLPILLYGCEVWGFEKLTQIESFYLKFCKSLLGVHRKTPNCMVYGELGRYKLEYIVMSRMLMFWYRIVNGKQGKLASIMYSFYYSLFESGTYILPWLGKIKSILDSLGFSYIWDSQAQNMGFSLFKEIVSQRLADTRQQVWHDDVNVNSQCIVYRIYKQKLVFEDYLVHLNPCDRKFFCRFRCLNNKLPIVTGRYANIPREDRICECCSLNQIGDEFHYLFQCPIFENDRKQAMKNFFWSRPNVQKMDLLFNHSKQTVISKLAKYCKVIVDYFDKH